MDEAANWIAPPELTGPVPRKISMSLGAMFVAAFAAILLAGSVPALIVFRGANGQAMAFNRILRTQGRETTGRIVRVWSTGGKSPTRTVSYTFLVDGVRVQGDSSVPSGRFAGLQRVQSLAIRYLPSDPKTNHPAAWEESVDAGWVPFTLPALMVGVGLVLLIYLRRFAAVTARGLPAAAIVTQCSSVKGGWAVGFRFRTEDGGSFNGASQFNLPKEVGAVLCVLYLPENPRRNQVYPSVLFRVAESMPQNP